MDFSNGLRLYFSKAYGQQAYEKMLSVTEHQENVNQNYLISLRIVIMILKGN